MDVVNEGNGCRTKGVRFDAPVSVIELDESSAIPASERAAAARLAHAPHDYIRDTYIREHQEEEVVHSIPEYGLFMHRDFFLRRWCWEIIRWHFFEPIVIFVILVNCGTMAAQSSAPGFEDTTLGQVLGLTDVIFLSLFTIELVFKMIALGVLMSPGSYFRSGWNYLDFVVVVTGYLALGPAGNYSAVRALRVLRPLRTLGLIGGLRCLVETLIQSLSHLVDVIYLAIFYFAVFGVITVQLYMGKFYDRCAEPDFSAALVVPGTTQLENVGHKDPAGTSLASGICTGPYLSDVTFINTSAGPVATNVIEPSLGHVCAWQQDSDPAEYPNGVFCVPWGNPTEEFHYRHFDNILTAWLAIFQHVTFCDYTFIMYDAQDAVSWWMWPLHVAMAVIGGFFIINLIIAVLYLHYDSAQAVAAEEAEEEEDEEEPTVIAPGMSWRRLFWKPRDPVMASKIPVWVSSCKSGWERLRLLLLQFISNKWFKLFSQAGILANCIVIGLHWAGQSSVMRSVCLNISTGLVGMFAIELILALIVRGFRIYLTEMTLLYDGAVIIASVTDVLLNHLAGGTIFSGSLSSLRLISLLILAGGSSAVSKIIKILLGAMGSVGYLILLLIMFMFTAGLIGMQVLGYSLQSCEWVVGSEQLCPPGLSFDDCPKHLDCYIRCEASQVGSWYKVDGSPYGGQAYCEQFPRDALPNSTGLEYWAQVGQPFVEPSNYDNIYQAIVSIFCLFTLDNWADRVYYSMQVTGNTSVLFYVLVIIVGNFVLLALFLAILLSSMENVAVLQEDAGDAKSLGGDDDDNGQEAGTEDQEASCTHEDATLGKDGLDTLFSMVEPKCPSHLQQSGMYVASPKGVLEENAESTATATATPSIRAPGQMSAGNSQKLVLSGDARVHKLSVLGDGGGVGEFLASQQVQDLKSGSELLAGTSCRETTSSTGIHSQRSMVVITGGFGASASDQGSCKSPGREQSNQQRKSRMRSLQAADGVAGKLVASWHPEPMSQAAGSVDGDRKVISAWNPVATHGGSWSEGKLQASDRRLAKIQMAAVEQMQASGSGHVQTAGSAMMQTAGSGMLHSAGSGRMGTLSPALSSKELLNQEFMLSREESSGRDMKSSNNLHTSLRTVKSLREASEASVLAGAVRDSLRDWRWARASATSTKQPSRFLGEGRSGSFGKGLFADRVQAPTSTSVNRMEEAEGTRSPWAKSSVHQNSHSMGYATPRVLAVMEEHHGQSGSWHQEASLEAAQGRSFNLFSGDNRVRLLLYMMVTSSLYMFLMIPMDILSCVILTIDTRSVPIGSSLDSAINIINYFTVSFFCVEVVMKMIAFGVLWNGTESYLRQGRNRLDFFVAILGLVILISKEIYAPESIPTWVVILDGLQGLRVVRACLKLAGVRVILKTFRYILIDLSNVLIIALAVYYIFAVIGTHMLAGKLNYCTDGDGLMNAYYFLPANQNINASWCKQDDGVHIITSSHYHSSLNVSVPPWEVVTDWTADPTRFDNAYQSIWTLFQMASTEGWVDIMLMTSAAVGVDQQPVENHSPSMDLYGIIFIVFGSFVTLGLLASVIISRFAHAQKEGRNMLLTEKQEEWLAIQKMLAAQKIKCPPKPPKNRFRLTVFDIVNSSAFEWTIMAVIILNTIVLCMDHWDMDPTMEDVLRLLNTIATGVYVIEVAMKWTALGIRQYFKAPWNVFDFCVASVSVAGVVCDFLFSNRLAVLSLLRMFRVVRLLSLVPKAKGLSMLVQSIIWVLPAAGNMALVLLMFMFIFAILGMNLFGNIGPGGPDLIDLDRHANFEDFPTTMLLLFRFLTGENWGNLMHDCMVTSYCIRVETTTTLSVGTNGTDVVVLKGTYLDPTDNADLISLMPSENLDNECSIAPIMSVIYFCSYMLWVTFMVAQLVIGIIMNEVQANSFLEGLAIQKEHVSDFRNAWNEMDNDGTGYIPIGKLLLFITHIPPPLGVKGEEHSLTAAYERIMITDIPNRNGRVHYYETLHALAAVNAGTEIPVDVILAEGRSLTKPLPREGMPPEYRTAAEFHSAATVAAWIKGHQIRYKLKQTYANSCDFTINGPHAPTSTSRASELFKSQPDTEAGVQCSTEQTAHKKGAESESGANGEPSLPNLGPVSLSGDSLPPYLGLAHAGVASVPCIVPGGGTERTSLPNLGSVGANGEHSPLNPERANSKGVPSHSCSVPDAGASEGPPLRTLGPIVVNGVPSPPSLGQTDANGVQSPPSK